MDPIAFVESFFPSQKTAPPPPGNSNPGVLVPNPLNPSTNMVVGPSASASSWSKWLDTAKSVFTAPTRAVEGAWTSFSQAGQKASGMVKTAISNSVGSVTGLSGFVKWIVVGLVAVAILYALIVFSPLISGLSSGIQGRNK